MENGLGVNKHGDKFWYKDGELHRIDGPAIELSNGHKEWWVNGELHRIDGPAVEYANGDKFWWINGQKYSEKNFKRLCKLSSFM